MNTARILLSSLLTLAAIAGVSSAWAGHSNVSIGLSFGVPVYGHYAPRHHHFGPHYHGPRYYGPPPFAYYPAPVYAAPVVMSPPVVVQQAQPQVYIEQPQQNSGVQPYENSPYWYFCAERNAYYPYVKSCASGWQQVTPTPQKAP